MTDDELRAMLREWQAPEASAGLRGPIFSERSPWWRMSIRIPIPVAVCLAVALILGAWRWMTPRVVVRTERIEVPIQRAISPLRPVDELRPRIIRGFHLEN